LTKDRRRLTTVGSEREESTELVWQQGEVASEDGVLNFMELVVGMGMGKLR
jgi:hypothetical protein